MWAGTSNYFLFLLGLICSMNGDETLRGLYRILIQLKRKSFASRARFHKRVIAMTVLRMKILQSLINCFTKVELVSILPSVTESILSV